MKRKIDNLQESVLPPLAMITLAACGGGGSTITPTVSDSSSVSGTVVKGPLQNALVFLDYDGDGIQDADEPSVRTEEDGGYTISNAAADYTLVAIADETTIDTSSGSTLSGITLKASKDASVVSPTSTLIEESGLTKAQVAAVLGLPDGVDPLSFNPYAAGANADDALAVEKASQQIMTAITSFASAAEGAGASKSASFGSALKSFAEVVTDKSTSGATLDLTSSSDLDAVITKLTTNVTNLAGIDTDKMNNVMTGTKAAIVNVNNKIKAITDTDLTSSATKNIFSTVSAATDDIKEASRTGNAVSFADEDYVNTASTNSVPTNIVLLFDGSGIPVIPEDFSSKMISQIIGFDEETNRRDMKYILEEIDGTDYDFFQSESLSKGLLVLKALPDYETKPSYEVVITAIDEGGKKITKTFEIFVEDNGVSPTLNFMIDAEDGSVFYTYNGLKAQIGSSQILSFFDGLEDFVMPDLSNFERSENSDGDFVFREPSETISITIKNLSLNVFESKFNYPWWELGSIDEVVKHFAMSFDDNEMDSEYQAPSDTSEAATPPQLENDKNIKSLTIILDDFSDRIFDIAGENVTLYDWGYLDLHRFYDLEYDGLDYDNSELISKDYHGGFYQVTPDNDGSGYSAVDARTTNDSDLDLVYSGVVTVNNVEVKYDDYLVFNREKQSSDVNPLHGDWSMYSFWEQLDNKQNTEILAIDFDIDPVFANGSYQYDHFFSSGGFESSLFDWFNKNDAKFTGNSKDSHYLISGMSVSIAGAPASVELDVLNELISMGVPIIQSAPNVNKGEYDWSTNYQEVISVGAWNTANNGEALVGDPSVFDAIDILANGYVLHPDWGWEFGTSFATPRVASEITNYSNEIIDYLITNGITYDDLAGLANDPSFQETFDYAASITEIIQKIGEEVSIDFGYVNKYYTMQLYQANKYVLIDDLLINELPSVVREIPSGINSSQIIEVALLDYPNYVDFLNSETGSNYVI